MKVYISGKISGLTAEEYMMRFNNTEDYLIRLGYEVINPARTNSTLPASTNYEEFMKMSFLMLSMCDTIYMLNNWKDSPGALSEWEYARQHGITILYQEDDVMKVLGEVCNHYCRFPEAYPAKEQDRMIDEKCNKCPLHKLAKIIGGDRG